MNALAAALPVRLPARRDSLDRRRPWIDPLAVCVALAAAVAAGERSPARFAVLASACLAASAGASALDHYPERGRTRRRPPPSGRLARGDSPALGVALIAASQGGIPVLGLLPSSYLLAGAATHAVLYRRWAEPRTPFGIVFGGAAGSFAALAGWQTAASTLRPTPLLLAAVIFLWTPSRTWALSIVLACRHRADGLPTLPVVAGVKRTAAAVHANTVGLVVAALALALRLSWPYAAVAVPACACLLGATFALRRRADIASAWRAYRLSGLYLLALLAGLVLSALR